MKEKIPVPGMRPGEALWRRAPSRDSEGRLVSDFMMLIPRLSSAPALRQERVFAELRALCRDYRAHLHLVDINLRLNLLWISVDSVPGIIGELAAEIRRRIPEAVLVGHEFGVGRSRAAAVAEDVPAKWNSRLRDRIRRLAGRPPALSPPGSGTR